MVQVMSYSRFWRTFYVFITVVFIYGNVEIAEATPTEVVWEQGSVGTMLDFPSDPKTFRWLEVENDLDASSIDEVRLMLYRGRALRILFEYKGNHVEATVPNLAPDEMSYSEGQVFLHFNEADGKVALRSLDKIKFQKEKWKLRTTISLVGFGVGVVAFPIAYHIPSALLLTASLANVAPLCSAYLTRQGLNIRDKTQLGDTTTILDGQQ